MSTMAHRPSNGVLEYEEDEDMEENKGLVSEDAVDHEECSSRFEERPIIDGPFRILGFFMAFALMVGSVALLLPNQNNPISPPPFQCPANAKLTDNLYDEMQVEYSNQAQNEFSNNMTEFLATFRHKRFDHWSHTYEQQKAAKRAFKTKYYAPYLKSGDSIFESAMGIGLNMYLTLEIINEAQGIRDLAVYGNEYVDASAEKANIIFDQAPPHHAKKGRICQGDSTSLEFVPSNAFDLVFTGYVTPSQDPLGFGFLENGNFYRYKTLCEDKDSNWQTTKLNEMAQLKSEDWYALWVGEMIRIAKPGAPVIVEQVQEPFCKPPKTSYPGEGGVAKSWWLDATVKYGWDINLASLDMEVDPIGDGENIRYNVFMQKNR